jgi:hypothetical protein
MSRTIRCTAAAVATLAAAITTPAAAQTTGTLNFTGSAVVRDIEPGAAGDRLLLDFLSFGSDAATPGAAGDIRAKTTTSGYFASTITPDVTTGLMTDLVATSTGFEGRPVNPYVQIGGYTFTLDASPAASGPVTFGPIQLTQLGNTTIAAFGVTGRVFGGAYGTAGADYTGLITANFAGLTAQQVAADIMAGRSHAVSFSGEFVAGSVVPEPSTYALLATGVAALGAFARRRRAEA